MHPTNWNPLGLATVSSRPQAEADSAVSVASQIEGIVDAIFFGLESVRVRLPDFSPVLGNGESSISHPMSPNSGLSPQPGFTAPGGPDARPSPFPLLGQLLSATNLSQTSYLSPSHHPIAERGDSTSPVVQSMPAADSASSTPVSAPDFLKKAW